MFLLCTVTSLISPKDQWGTSCWHHNHLWKKEMRAKEGLTGHLSQVEVVYQAWALIMQTASAVQRYQGAVASRCLLDTFCRHFIGHPQPKWKRRAGERLPLGYVGGSVQAACRSRAEMQSFQDQSRRAAAGRALERAPSWDLRVRAGPTSPAGLSGPSVPPAE